MSWRALLRDELKDLEAPGPGPAATVRMDGNDSPFPLPADLAESLGRELAAVSLNRYPDPSARAAREACAAWLGVQPEAICLGNGSDELVAMIVQAFGKPRRGETRARVAYPVPTFAAYRVAAAACGALPLEMPLKDDFTLDASALERQVTGGKPNVVFMARPNNPTGTLWEREIIERFVERHADMMVVIDEAYGDYAGESLVDLVLRRENAVVIRSASALGLPGLRLGVAVGQPDVVAEINKVRLPFNVGALTQRAAAFLIGGHHARLREHHDQIVAERERLFAALLEGRRGQPFPSRANFLLVRVADPDGVVAALLERGFAVRNVSRPGPLRGCLRVTLGSADDNAAFLRAFNDVVAPQPAAPAPGTDEKADDTEEADEAEADA
jgi:histidinol-phosphate aminotransferase